MTISEVVDKMWGKMHHKESTDKNEDLSITLRSRHLMGVAGMTPPICTKKSSATQDALERHFGYSA